MEPIRVLEIVTDMGRGGIETMLMNYYRHMDRSAVQLDFLVHRQKRAVYDDEIENLGGKIYRLSPLNPFSIGYHNELDAFFLAHPEYKIVHCHLDCMAGIPLHSAKKHGVPVRIAHAHSSNQTKNSKYPLKLLFKRGITKQATQLFACGEAAGKWMFSGKSFTVMSNAVDAVAFRYNAEIRKTVREELFAHDSNALVIGHVGSFWAPKNHLFLVDVFREVHKREPNSILLLVGTGGLMDAVREKVQNLGLQDSVHLIGDRKDVYRVMQAMDIFILPSLFEGLPVTMVEAQASGLPCFVSDKVPLECKKTDLVTQISLQKPAEYWADQILKAQGTERRDTYAEIASAGFDIVESAKWLQNFYLAQWKANE